MNVRHILCLASLLVLLFAANGFAGEVQMPTAVSGTGFDVPVKSVKELKESRVVKQTYDFSCGSAAVATLLTFSYNQPTSEREAFDTMWAVGDQEHIKKFGFSLLDMQKYLASRGYHAVGYKITLDKLRRLRVPAIALIHPGGYNHFVVVRGWRNDAAIVADPAKGLNRVTSEEFKGVWNGIVFVLRDNANLAQNFYNDPRDFKLIPRSIVSSGMLYAHGGASEQLMNIPIFNDY